MTSLTARIIVAKRFRRAGLQYHLANRVPETQRSIRHQHAAPRPRSGAPLQWESGRAPTGAAAIFRRLGQEAGTARAVPAPCRYSAATA